MNLLLDTHAFLWWVAGDPLPVAADAAIRNPEHTVWLSAASAWRPSVDVDASSRTSAAFGVAILRLPKARRQRLRHCFTP